MNTQPTPRQLRRYPLGALGPLDGNTLGCKGREALRLTELFSDPSLGQKDEGWQLIADLVGEVLLQRKIIKEMIRREKAQITSPNEFHRGVVSFAHKVNVHPDELKEVVEPLLQEVFAEMLARPERGKRQR